LDSGSIAKSTESIQRLLELNNAHAVELSRLEPSGMAELIDRAFLAMSLPNGSALLIAFDQDADYASPNFLWFRERYDRFVYIDRVVVSPIARGRGYARQLYEALFLRARAAGYDCVVCEINIDPPNPVSDAFHERLNFVEVGVATIHGGAKSVRYMSRRLVS
jgi:predicted GNAT superfamily acetyltransferase